MPEDDRERFEDYLELEQFIEELQEGHAAHPPTELTPEKANIYHMAALFRSATPDAAEPRPEFAAELHARLEQELQQPTEEKPGRFSFLRKKPQQAGNQEGRGAGKEKGKKPVSRRALIAGSAAAAASLVVGAGIMHEIDQPKGTSQGAATAKPKEWSMPLISADKPTTWHFVTTLAELGNNVVRFATDTVIGYVTIDDTKGDTDNGKIVAMSAACTHMGCLVQWQASEQLFVCPCHDGRFSAYGDPYPKAEQIYLAPLPRLNTKVENGNVYVEVPNQASTPSSSKPQS